MLFDGLGRVDPLFCDSGFVILNPIRKALVKRNHDFQRRMTVSLSAGSTFPTYVFLPTLGPIAAAKTLGIGNNLLLVMGMGVSRIDRSADRRLFLCEIHRQEGSGKDEADSSEVTKTYEQLVAEYGKLRRIYRSGSDRCADRSYGTRLNRFHGSLDRIFIRYLNIP